MKTPLIVVTILVFFINGLMAQYTEIVDANFEQALIDLGYDTGTPDGLVLTENINTITYLNIPSKEISDLTGIEDFTSLIELWCNDNSLTELNISSCSNLTFMNCSDNQLIELDVSNNVELTELWISSNQISAIDISQNTNLIKFTSWENPITNLDVSNNTNLENLWCSSGLLTNIDVSNNPALRVIDVQDNLLTELDVSINLNLIWLFCSNNQIATLNLSNNVSLVSLYCNDNLLTLLNVKNGNNHNVYGFHASGNNDLSCIQVDDANWSEENWTDIDASSSFSEDCEYNGIKSDNIICNYLVYPNPNQGELKVELGATKNNVKAIVINYLGQTMYAKHFESINEISMNLNLPTGYYFLKLEVENVAHEIVKFQID